MAKKKLEISDTNNTAYLDSRVLTPETSDSKKSALQRYGQNFEQLRAATEVTPMPITKEEKALGKIDEAEELMNVNKIEYSVAKDPAEGISNDPTRMSTHMLGFNSSSRAILGTKKTSLPNNPTGTVQL